MGFESNAANQGDGVGRPGVTDPIEPSFPMEPVSKPISPADTIKSAGDANVDKGVASSGLDAVRISDTTANAVTQANRSSMEQAQAATDAHFGGVTIDSSSDASAAKQAQSTVMANDSGSSADYNTYVDSDYNNDSGYNPDDYAPAQNSPEPGWDPADNPLQLQLELNTLTAPTTL